MRKYLFFLLLIFLIPPLCFGYLSRHFYKPLRIKHTKTAREIYEETFVSEKFKSPPAISFDLANYTDDPNFDISSKYSFAVNLTNGRVLFNKNSRKRVPVASLVKVMTAIVALEHAAPSKEIIVSEYAASIGENVMGISAGEIYTLEDLLYGLILNSGNDAAVAIAEGVAGSEENFVEWMNIKAKELGLKDTKFVDPNGLDTSNKEYYSSAYDLAVITKYALDNFPLLRKIFSTFEHEISYNENHKYLYLQNQTNLLTTYPGVKGIKTGYTKEAGWCLITYSENEGQKILGVILDAVNRRYDGILLLDYSFQKEGVVVKHNLL